MGLEARGCGSSGVVAREASLVLSASGGDVTVDAPTLLRTGGVPLLDRDRLLLRLCKQDQSMKLIKQPLQH